ncbi:uncharacterized protein At3g17950 [Ananas comosus]|uniref:Uncharacterized protein At3g17950 n=1 Tax=Ananas comosus TaxID=4615 RepID=A0A6P5GXM8_ANACO|nr:uncharacterized protein At3g17950 [Ananas comosus]
MALNRDHDLIPSSPSNSSLSSSDLDTESTGSFFPDRSTSLGTLMGVSFPDLPAPRPARRDHHGADAGGRRPRPRAPERRRRSSRGGGRGWWRLCRDDAAAPASLGEFLQVERRIGGGAVDGDYVYGAGGGGGAAEHEAVGGGPLFEDGRVLPPEGRRRGQQRAAEGPVGRWPVLLTGICTGGEA